MENSIWNSITHIRNFFKKVSVEGKQPNSACRKCAKLQLKKNNKSNVTFVPRDGNIEFIDENDRVFIAGLGRKRHTVGDLPGVLKLYMFPI